MKLSELTTCVSCGGKVAPVFYRVTTEQMIVDANAVKSVLGLSQALGGNLALAESMAPADDVTIELQSDVGLVCQDCFLASKLAAVLFPEVRPGDNDS